MTTRPMKYNPKYTPASYYTLEWFKKYDPAAAARIEASEAQQAAIMAVDIWKMNPTPEQEAVVIKTLIKWLEIQHQQQQG